MIDRRRVFAYMAFMCLGSAIAQSPPPATEAALRDVFHRYEQAWNRHDVQAWAAFLCADVWFTQAWDSYERQKGRDNAVALFESNFKDSDLTWEVLGLRMMPDGSVTVKLRHVLSYLPKVDGKYRIVFDKAPVVSRWRLEDGQWRMFFFTSDKGWALDLLKKDGLE